MEPHFYSEQKKRRSPKQTGERRYLCARIGWICRQPFQFLHQMRNNTIATLCMVLPVDILHNLLVSDWIIPLVNTYFIPLIKPVSQQGHHRLSDSIMILRFLLNPLDLPSVLPGDDT